ncbi:MAG: hypothetical protein HYV33_05710 [Candidatus Kerfeldbacteria bacterium]|nr:hypothetical protein [Candidatus Kerfeldbacteria bacterium]
MRRIVLIDGENFKAKIQSVFYHTGLAKPKWHTYDFRQLFSKVFNGLSRE